MTDSSLRFLADQMVSVPACVQLRAKGVDIEHVLEAGLGGASDAAVLAYAGQHKRIVITRNYQDFAPLVQAYVKNGTMFPGVLFLSTSIEQSSVAAHVSALLDFVTSHAQGNPIDNTYGWLPGAGLESEP